MDGADSDADDDGKTATFPFLSRLFGGPSARSASDGAGQSQGGQAAPGRRQPRAASVSSSTITASTSPSAPRRQAGRDDRPRGGA